MIVYTGPIDDSRELIQFLRRERNKLRLLRKLVVSRDNTVIRDVNGEGIEFPGLTYGCAVLDELLRELGIVFPFKTLHDPESTPDGIREFVLSACWTWGHG